jgi:hypothetical protein
MDRRKCLGYVSVTITEIATGGRGEKSKDAEKESLRAGTSGVLIK